MSEDNNRSRQSETAKSDQPSDWFKEFTRFLEGPKKQVPSQTKQLGTQLLSQARGDLWEFRRKYDSRDYARAIFWLQQAAEKATKGFLLLLGAIGEDDLQRKIGHLTPVAFLQAVESQELNWLPGWLEWLQGVPQLKGVPLAFDVDEVRRTLRKERHSFATLRPDQVDVLIQLSQSFKTVLPLMTVKWALYQTSWPETKASRKLIAKGDTKEVSKFAITLMRLYIIGLITFPHWDTTRYPGESMSPLSYTVELGVVAKATTLASMLTATLRELDSYI